MARTFYQNSAINPATMNFNFAHVYSNRYEMDTKTITDGIYPGRYVLVEYDKNFEPVTKNEQGKYDYLNSYSYKTVYALKYNNGIPQAQSVVNYNNNRYTTTKGTYLTSVELEESHVILYSDSVTYDEYDVPIGVTKDTVVMVTSTDENTWYFYRALEGTVDQPAVFEVLEMEVHTEGSSKTVYYEGRVIGSSDASHSEIYGYNYFIDKSEYADMGRGYDSTVWQKVISDGSPKYVQIAELNSVTPTFELLIDEPSMDGQRPYFDEISSNVYYRLHDTPHWGLRVKAAENQQGYLIDEKGTEISSKLVNNEYVEAEKYKYSTDNTIYPSDTNVTWQRSIYGGVQYYNGETENWDGNATTSLPGAIYFNKDGFDKEEIHYSSEKINNPDITWSGKDEITITPTGKSGRIYNNRTTSSPDIQELSIMLPTLGDTVAELWNIAYGDENTNLDHWVNRGLDAEDYKETRHTDITWHDANDSEEEKTKGLRLVDYAITPAETYKHAPENVATLAGCINSIHDLMGMIIFDGNNIDRPINPNDSEEVEELSSDYIYYIGGKYYRRGIETVLDPDYDPNDLYQEINVIHYNPNDVYFYKDLTNYKRLLGDPDENLTYYQFRNESNDMQAVDNLAPAYEPFRYYYSVNTPQLGTLRVEEGAPNRPPYYDLNFETRTIAFYKPGTYYTQRNPDGPIDSTNLELSYSNTKSSDDDLIYYLKYTYTVYDQEANNTKEIVEYQGIRAGDLTQWNDAIDSSRYYHYDNGNYIPYTQPPIFQVDPLNPPKEGQGVDLRVSVLLCTNYQNLNQGLTFYVPNQYYYKFYIGPEEQGDNRPYDYYLDSNPNKTIDRQYYVLVNEPVKVDKFYKDGEYYHYIYNSDTESYNYVLDVDGYDNEQYYEQLKLYVKQDKDGYYKIGSIWNQSLGVHNEDLGEYEPAYNSSGFENFENAKLITGLQLGAKKTKYVLYELSGFARNLNTIHGMLLKINALLNTDDELTRDTGTVQGCINYLNDIIDIFGGLKPNSFNIVDNRGKVVSADVVDDDWIAVAVDGATRTVSFTHEFTAVDNTNSRSNLNDLNPDDSIKNTIELYTPKVDVKGHVVGENIEEVTLPFGFKKLKTTIQSGNGAIWSTAAQSTDITIVADNTQDELTFTTGNKWIRVVADDNTDTLTLAHETQNISVTEELNISNNQIDLFNNADRATFDTSTYNYDNAGHITARDIQRFVLPNSFNAITDGNMTASSTVTSDTLRIVGDDNWISPQVIAKNINESINLPTLKLTHTHKGGGVTTSTLSGQNGIDLSNSVERSKINLESYTLDEVGHIQTKITTEYTLPNSYSIITDGTRNLQDELNTISAAVTSDTLTIKGNTNGWIDVKVGSGNTITISHNNAKVPTTPATAISPVTVPFGGNFTIRDLLFDDKGHNYGSNSHTVTIPSLTITSLPDNFEQEGTVIENIGLVDVPDSVNKQITRSFKSVKDLIINYNPTALSTDERTFKSSNITLHSFLETTDNTFHALRTQIGATNDNIGQLSTNLTNRVVALETDTTETTTPGTLVNRVATLESSISSLSGNGAGSVTSQISSAINTYDNSKNFGTVITHDATEFESAGAAAAVQGGTTSTVADLEIALDDYILKTEAVGYDDILTTTNASNVIYSDENQTDPTEMTVGELIAYVKDLEARIAALEPSGGNDPEPSGGGEEPEPQTTVEIEVVSGTPTLISGTFADAYTDASGTLTYNYSVTVDNVVTTVESVVAEAIGEPAVETIHIYLDNTGDYYLDWTADGLTLIDNRE